MAMVLGVFSLARDGMLFSVTGIKDTALFNDMAFILWGFHKLVS